MPTKRTAKGKSTGPKRSKKLSRAKKMQGVKTLTVFNMSSGGDRPTES